MRTRSAAALAILAALAIVPTVRAQSLQVTGDQPLQFGTMIQGIDMAVAPTDAGAAAQFSLRSNGNAYVQLSFTLPAALNGPGGARLPLIFGPTDGGFSRDRTIGNQVPFDPRVPFVGQLRGGRATVYLGGLARPAASQTPGSYTGTVTLTVVIAP